MRSTDNPWLNRFAWLVAAATWLLIGMGGLVTSHEAGLAVPDWPTTYGYNMFLFPVSLWRGGVFYEHTHRLAASTVGLLTTVLAIWLWRKDCRPFVRRLGVAAFFVVVLQGVLGGLRVTLLKSQIGIFHAALAQIYLCLLCAIALITSPWWQALVSEAAVAIRRAVWLRSFALAATLLVFAQLVLGATMRHQHAGLAIPDFPLAYGKLWPSLDPGFIAAINQNRIDAAGYQPITAAQIYLQLAHRLLAVLILIAISGTAWMLRRFAPFSRHLGRFALVWLGLTMAQALLGALTIWSNKAADVATLHVMVGALSLVLGTQLTVILFRAARVARVQPSPVATQNVPAAAWTALRESPSAQSAGASS